MDTATTVVRSEIKKDHSPFLLRSTYLCPSFLTYTSQVPLTGFSCRTSLARLSLVHSSLISPAHHVKLTRAETHPPRPDRGCGKLSSL